MTSLKFALSPENVSRIHDVLICLAKFHESIGLEATKDKLTLSALNSSKTSSASFAFESGAFFQSYRFIPDSRQANDIEVPFTCKILAKALLSVFKGRIDIESEAALERCEVNVLEHPEKTECRFIIKMICRHGVKKTYKLTYEPVEVLRAVFDKNTARNKWKIAGYVLKAFSEFFGPRAENLDICHENGRAAFTCYTEKIVHKNEVLKQPLHTTVAIDISDFEEFEVEENVHTAISVKDFKAVILHADTLKASIYALYSHPTRPLQLSYTDQGMQCEFTLMTMGEYRGSSVMTTASRPSTAQPPPRQNSRGPVIKESRAQSVNSMPPPVQPASRSFGRDGASQRLSRPSPPPPRASVNEESLFVADDDEEEKLWGEKNLDEDEGELRWDSARSNLQSQSFTRIRSFETATEGVDREEQERRIAPTQRMSGIKGLFDE